MSAPTAVVSGAASGLGRAVVHEAVRRGYRVTALVRSEDDRARSLVDEAGARGGEVRLVVADLRSAADIVRAAADLDPQVHLLVNCAGVLRESRLDDGVGAAWVESLQVNARAAMLLSRAVASGLADSRGAIVNVASDGGVTGSVLGPAYGASKAAMIGLSKTLARELAPHVRVNAVAPGPIDTQMWRDASEDDKRQVEAQTPLGRVATPQEIAAVCLDVAGWTFVTGQTLVVDGGRVM